MRYYILFAALAAALMSVSACAAQPINPLVNASYPAGMGIVSYGVYNNSGTLVPYKVSTNTVYGFANITALQVSSANYSIYNYTTFTQTNSSPDGTSVQLNVLLNAIDRNNTNQSYWLQDVAVFNTSNHTVYFDDEVWNFTSANGTITNSTVIGNGYASPVNSTVDSYDYNTTPTMYSLPFAVLLTIHFVNTSRGMEAQFGYDIIKNGTGAVSSNVFDKILMLGRYRNASIIVNPYRLAGNVSPYDAELVIGGEANGTSANFTALNAKLGLWYLSGSGIVPFPAVYDFSSDTAEGAFNANVVMNGGYADITVGNPQFGVVSDSFAPPFPLSNATAITNASTSITTTVPVTSASVSTTSSIPPAPAQGSSSVYGYLPYVVIVVVVLLILAVAASRMRKKPAQPKQV